MGAPPFIDDVFIPLSDPGPYLRIDRVVRAAQMLDNRDTAFGFTIQYGPGKSEGCIVLRGLGKTLAQQRLQSYEFGEKNPTFAD